MPAPVVADALSYHPVTTTKIATQAGTTWSRYAPGDLRAQCDLAAAQAVHRAGKLLAAHPVWVQCEKHHQLAVAPTEHDAPAEELDLDVVP